MAYNQYNQQAGGYLQQPSHQQADSYSSSVNSYDRGNASKVSAFDAPEDKSGGQLHTKADPMMAMNEAEPAMVAAKAQTTHTSLRSMQHKDSQGNPIADPDWSNPTRYRWERPLDTIRGFQAATEGERRRQ